MGICEICGGAATHSKATCWRCNKGVGRIRGTCFGCGKPERLLDHELRCRWCRENQNKHCADCRRSGVGLLGYDGTRVCQACALRRELDKVIPAEPAGALAPLRPVILAAEPLTTRRWLRRAHDLLTGLDQGLVPLDHSTLDDLPHTKSVEHLRALLVAAEILPPDPAGPIRRLENSSTTSSPVSTCHTADSSPAGPAGRYCPRSGNEPNRAASWAPPSPTPAAGSSRPSPS